MSQRRSEYQLVPGDSYYTPVWVTEALCDVEKLPEPVWEPAAGGAHMFGALCCRCSCVRGTDLATGRDFLHETSMYRDSKSIVTNPPYSNGLAEKFVRHALKLTKPVQGKVAMLLPLAWDSAKGRRDLFAEHPAFKAKYTLTRRIRWVNLEQKKNGPSQNHAWYVWDWECRAVHMGTNKTRHPICGYLP